MQDWSNPLGHLKTKNKSCNVPLTLTHSLLSVFCQTSSSRRSFLLSHHSSVQLCESLKNLSICVYYFSQELPQIIWQREILVKWIIHWLRFLISWPSRWIPCCLSTKIGFSTYAKQNIFLSSTNFRKLLSTRWIRNLTSQHHSTFASPSFYF